MSLVQGESFNGPLADLTDAAGQYANPSRYSATFSVNGVDYPVSFAPDWPQDGMASMSIALPAFSPMDTWGALNVAETVDGASVSASAIVPIHVAVNAACQAPTGLAATAVSPNEVDLSWSNDGGNSPTATVECSTDGGVTFSQLPTVGGGLGAYQDTAVAPGINYVCIDDAGQVQF
ncbi:MAG TPA: hypothetical protein VG326_16120 [Tepidisphaeraceae bacterium]|nr:hypothetical protein [Tepidisphaeraceae bacterium]